MGVHAVHLCDRERRAELCHLWQRRPRCSGCRWKQWRWCRCWGWGWGWCGHTRHPSISDPWGVRVSVVPSFSTAHLQGLIDKGSAFVEELRGENAAWTLSQDESLTALVNAFADRSDVDPLALLPDKLLPTVEVRTCYSRHSACLGP